MTTADSLDRGRMRRRSLVALVVTAIVGMAIGTAITQTWPNAVYGHRLIAGALVLLLVLVAATLRSVVPIVFAAAVGLAAGVIGGMMLGDAAFAPPPTFGLGRAQVNLTEPQADLEGSAQCALVRTAEQSFLFTASDGSEMVLPDGRALSIAISLPGYGPTQAATRSDGLGVQVEVFSTLADGSPTSTTMVSTTDSELAVEGDEQSGSMTFSGLVLSGASEQPEPIELAGTVGWSCPSG